MGEPAISQPEPPPLSIEASVEAGAWPDEDRLAAIALDAVEAALGELDETLPPETELSLVFTDDRAIRVLNRDWRKKDKPTNVLSFPAPEPLPGVAMPASLGDIVLAFETVSREAEAENKGFDSHLTHLIVHGFLHLLGFDHEDDAEAEAMEAVERRVLARLGIADPYAETDMNNGDALPARRTER
ncbi:MAG: rRNA maturation RNase YbeY [Methylobacterium mesophilicum]|nr:rRNA maturation RNase YbeY [Methylobacterium mesophilicum]